MKTEEHDPSSIDPSGFWRFVFWLAYALGTISLLFSWMFAQVSSGRDSDRAWDFVIPLCALILILTSILMACWLWNIKNPFRYGGDRKAMSVVLEVAWFELAVAIYATVALLTYSLLHGH
ncbi:MAG TPA: hypothetical protein VKS44_05320 [Candidatus Acidoferrales bacterium]|nr:hypothetical protein [Candidatus Acidoferrales bacterium]